MSRQTLGTARSSKRDEFYTLYSDVKFELDHYLNQFKNKIIYCPCDTDDSAFTQYFLELERSGVIKELVHTSLQDGIDFLSDSAVDEYRRCDIVVTNPPFSLFRQFLSLLDELNKEFIIWGTNNCISYREFSKMLVKNRIGLGYTCNKTCTFEVPFKYFNSPDSKAFCENNKYYIKVPGCSVFTNLYVCRTSVDLTAKFNDSYKKYSNFNAINVNRTSDIPCDYSGLMGVPITYLSKHDPTKFNIVGIFNNFDETNYELGRITGDLVKLDKPPWRTRGPCIDGNHPTYVRILIQKISNS